MGGQDPTTLVVGSTLLVFAALVWSLLPVAASAARPPAHLASAHHAPVPAKYRGSAAKRRERRILAAQLRKNPRTAFRGSFLRRAQAVGFQTPVTVRLRPGTQLALTVLHERRPLDTTAFPEPPGVQTVGLAGQFAMQLDFGAGPGYGTLGNIQARTGQYVALTSTDPLRLAAFGDCGLTPPVPTPDFLTSTPGSTMTLSSGGLTWSDLNPFSGAADGSLSLVLRLRSRVGRASATCATLGDVADFDLPAPATTSAWSTPMRVDWNGAFRIAPAITPSGSLRLGKISVDAATVPQPITTGNLWACAPDATLSGPTVPPAAPCTETSAPLTPVMEPVSAAPFPAQLTVKTLLADVLLGDIPVPAVP